MANVKNNASAQETKRKLVEAAGAVFAEMGFERATIKDITDRAGVSIAAVNYHFSDKQELYFHVVRKAHDAGVSAFASLQAQDPTAPPQDRFHAFVRRFMTNTLDPTKPGWHSQIIMNEIRHPTEATARFVNEVVRPYVINLESLMKELLGRDVTRRKLTLLINSVMSQCLHYVNNRCLAEHLYPEDPPAAERIDELVQHITDFSVAALQCMPLRDESLQDGFLRDGSSQPPAIQQQRVAKNGHIAQSHGSRADDRA